MVTAIYEAKGSAREYSELACNLYRGCGHQCLYCYGPQVLHTDKAKFADPEPRKGILEQLQKDSTVFLRKGETRPVLFCFLTDPYQPIDEAYQLTRQAIMVLKEHGWHVMILTKGGNHALRDFDLLDSKDCFGVTLTLLNEEGSRKWEPHAAPPAERIETLKVAHAQGIPTWVSLEPVIAPPVTLEIIKLTHEFVDEYKVGVMNYMNLGVDWRQFANDVTALLDNLGCKYYLKRDLRRWLEKRETNNGLIG